MYDYWTRESSIIWRKLFVALPTAAARSGRPKDIAKHEAIIKAARALFASQPFDQVTMEAVAAQAGVSKMTVYSHFRDKEALFETIVLTVSDQMISAMHAPEQGGLRERLIAIGNTFLGIVLGSDVCKMAHTLPGVLRENPALAQRFLDAGPGRVRAALAAIIQASVDEGELDVDDAELAADDLVSLWEGGMPAKIAFGLLDLSSAQEIERRAKRGTEVFLRAYRAGGCAVQVERGTR